MRVDHLIIGQGLAGTLLAHFLLQAGRRIVVVDDGRADAASRVSLGLCDPISGRNLKRPWRAEALFPCAEKTYRELESLLGLPLYREINICKIFLDERQQARWRREGTAAAFQPLLRAAFNAASYPAVRMAPGCLSYRGGVVQLHVLLPACRRFLHERQALREQPLQYATLEMTADGIRWGEISAASVIFCEGAGVRDNPWFRQLPLVFTKGETVDIRAAGLPADWVLSKGIFVLPLGGEAFRVGATHDRGVCDTRPTAAGRDELLGKLATFFNGAYEITGQHAGVRTALPDYRPVLGAHPKYPRLYVFNALGGKGATQAPFFARQLAQHLLAGGTIDREVGLRTFPGHPDSGPERDS